jgi:hypothetical protein
MYYFYLMIFIVSHRNAPVIGYHTKWLTGWTNEWFYVKYDEKKRENS